MNIAAPVNTSPALVVQAVSPHVQLTREERQHDLQLHQMIRATVEEGGQDKLLLRLNDRELLVESRLALKAGTQLNLKVVQTEPTLKLQILEPTLLGRLGGALHHLESRFDVAGLLQALAAGREPAATQLGGEVRAVISQLLSLLQPESGGPSAAALAQLTRALGLGFERELGGQNPSLASLKGVLLELLGQQDRQQAALGERLASLGEALRQWPLLLREAGQPAAAAAAAVSPEARPVLDALANLLQQQAAAATAGSKAGVEPLMAALRAYLVSAGPETASSLSGVERALLLFPELALVAAQAHVYNRPGLRHAQRELLDVLLRLFRQPAGALSETQAQSLGRQLARAFEREIFSAYVRARGESRESLEHLEAWQLCRARLAETSADFVPLPLAFLDKGFLVARHQGNEAAPGDVEANRSLTLLLHLQGLGDLQIDVLCQPEGTYARFLCAGTEQVEWLAGQRAQLGEQLGGRPLLGVSFTTGARNPTRALVEQMIPAEKKLLDARV